MHGLDALCRRFEIDTSARTVSYAYSEQKAHGALLDSQMLAQVYLAMTGGQSVLFSDTNHTNQEETNESSVIKVDIDQARIKVIQANKTEVEAHNIYFEKV
ncbi:MAG TPA: hypothetical protein EYQ04_05215 [Candidatus Thioglobus sp.]|nr:hypothetical protein [Candidatus Thioglobus sp.]